jgi:ribosomal-protein-alanine N-acetyltransferase
LQRARAGSAAAPRGCEARAPRDELCYESQAMKAALTVDATGERVRLRAPRVADNARLMELRERSWGFLAPWSPLAAPDARDPEAQRAALVRQRKEWATDRAYRFVMAERESDAAIGRVSLGEVVRGVFQNAYLGYWIDQEYTRRGLMTEGVRLALDLAFGALGLHRVQAAIIPRNEASLGVARKVGLRREGLAERYLFIAGRWEDHVIFATTKEEWAGRVLRPDGSVALAPRAGPAAR